LHQSRKKIRNLRAFEKFSKKNFFSKNFSKIYLFNRASGCRGGTFFSLAKATVAKSAAENFIFLKKLKFFFVLF